jgi:ribose transport system ATP-binding protein
MSEITDHTTERDDAAGQDSAIGREDETGATGSILRVEDLIKSYRNVTALAGVSIRIKPGEVVGLVGENGAGKSTLLKILTGVIQPDSGQIVIDGREETLANVNDAAEKGISLVHQEQDLITNLTGAENLFMGREDDLTPFGYFNKERVIEAAQERLDELGIPVDPSKRTADLSFNERQLIEIAKAFVVARSGGRENPVILLDEPTSGLEEESRELLFDLIDDLRGEASFVFVSHELNEVIDVSDRTYVLKDGELVNEIPATEATEERLRESMVGRSSSEDFYTESEQLSTEELGETVLTANDLAVEGEVGPLSFSLQRGEILGVVGVDGSGKERLGRMLFGDTPATSGSLTVLEEELVPTSPVRMKTAGIGYVPKDRKSDGLLLYQPVRHNVSLAVVEDLLEGLPLLDASEERRITERVVDDLNIKTPDINTLANALSGGNQQKMLLARWLAKDSPVLVLDNVTRGIDVGTKEEIYEICRELTQKGVSIVFIGDELPEVIGIANRILVMYKGQIADVIEAPAGDKPSETEVIERMI